MGEYLSPGLYTSERSASAGAVAGVSTSTYATVGWLRKGPENVPQLLSSFDQFVDTFGTYWRNSYVPFIVSSFFSNDGGRAYVSRVVPSDAVAASNSSSFDDAATAAEFIGRELPATTDLSTNKYIAIKIDGVAAVQVDCSAGAAVPAAVTPEEMASAIDLTAGIACTVVTVATKKRLKIVSDTTGVASGLEFVEPTVNGATKEVLGLTPTASPLLTYLYSGEAASDWTETSPWKGAWYNQVRMCISGNSDYEDGHGGFSRYNVETQEESALGEADWTTRESYEAVVMDDDDNDHFISTVINGETNFCKITNGASYNALRALRAKRHLAEWVGVGDGAAVAFSITLMRPVVHFSSLSLIAGSITGADDGDGNITGTGISSGSINYTTGQLSVTFAVAPSMGTQVLVTYYQEPASEEVCAQLISGTDGTGPLTRGDVSDPALEADKEGIYAFNILDEILNISLPDFAGVVAVSNDLIAYSEVKKNRFSILTTAIGTTPQNAVKYVRNTAQFNTSYAAIYYPWIKIYDPIANDGRSMTIPPDGAVAGVYARTDTNRNVGKAPAGITDGVIRGIVGMERVLEKGERDLLYPARINPLVSSPQTGYAVWGARSLSLDAEWRYIQARRLFMFCEQSVHNASFWTVFENNGPGLWTRILAQGNAFFLNLFRDGYFAGASPSEAFYIKCDEDNNPQSAIDSGLLTAYYYIAPNKPAEFVRLVYQQQVKALA